MSPRKANVHECRTTHLSFRVNTVIPIQQLTKKKVHTFVGTQPTDLAVREWDEMVIEQSAIQMLVAYVEMNIAMHWHRDYVPVQVWYRVRALWFEGLEFSHQTLYAVLSMRRHKTRRIRQPIPLLPSVSRLGAILHFVIVVPV